MEQERQKITPDVEYWKCFACLKCTASRG